MKLHITEKAVKEIIVPAGKKHILIFDTEQVGFAVQKTGTGNMSYIVMYRDEFKKQRQEKLGKVGEISANAARAMACAYLKRLEDHKRGCLAAGSCFHLPWTSSSSIRFCPRSSWKAGHMKRMLRFTATIFSRSSGIGG
ncbi:integrase arm-type DNA-binding domain-containing protein [Neopusillimonas aromaticivorans]|uniref:integrase arm-type DNA-binding domain-containing protein n=1 Tax=Neopusillimonas aromaticivorans TaxID=2979868 RepID=UPI002596527D|nr:integrase arm-type DNA-binding domain-containing protein [Neopusillimonas aromaticivorans]WJJ94711.1 hypothetical protein N7E01_07350 [Neopusillimonas aromaticivorans]